jgi:hypothetical protein
LSGDNGVPVFVFSAIFRMFFFGFSGNKLGGYAGKLFQKPETIKLDFSLLSLRKIKRK